MFQSPCVKEGPPPKKMKKKKKERKKKEKKKKTNMFKKFKDVSNDLLPSDRFSIKWQQASLETRTRCVHKSGSLVKTLPF